MKREELMRKSIEKGAVPDCFIPNRMKTTNGSYVGTLDFNFKDLVGITVDDFTTKVSIEFALGIINTPDKPPQKIINAISDVIANPWESIYVEYENKNCHLLFTFDKADVHINLSNLIGLTKDQALQYLKYINEEGVEYEYTICD